MRWLVHLSIVCGLVCNGVYWLLARESSGAYAIAMVFGLTYMTGSIIQSDLAARACSLKAAGTLFALFMAICNLGSALSTWFGGRVYDHASAVWSGEDAFRILILINAVFTAGCWLVVKFLPDDLLGTPLEAANVESQALAETTVAV
jgi:MFS family permease